MTEKCKKCKYRYEKEFGHAGDYWPCHACSHNYEDKFEPKKEGELIMAIEKQTVKELISQIGNHSGKICNLVFELKSTWGSPGSPANERASKLKEEIAVQNECIQEILVSFHDLYLGD